MANLQESMLHATLAFGDATEEDINSGKCFEWAAIVFDLMRGSKIAGQNIEGHGHCWIEYDGKCYDAESQQGVDDWSDLPFFQRIKKR